jgi:hypothetical protein
MSCKASAQLRQTNPPQPHWRSKSSRVAAEGFKRRWRSVEAKRACGRQRACWSPRMRASEVKGSCKNCLSVRLANDTRRMSVHFVTQETRRASDDQPAPSISSGSDLRRSPPLASGSRRERALIPSCSVQHAHRPSLSDIREDAASARPLGQTLRVCPHLRVLHVARINASCLRASVL